MSQISDELEESAYVCGGSWWQTFRRVTIPLIRDTYGADVILFYWLGAVLFVTGSLLDILDHLLYEVNGTLTAGQGGSPGSIAVSRRRSRRWRAC